MPGWSNIGWIEYCRAVTDIYRRAFDRSRLEFDIDRLGWISAKGTPSDRAAAEALVAYFNAHNIFLAMNGFDTQNVADWRAQAPTGVARSLAFIAARTRAGLDAGLEGAPLTNPKWQNIAVLAAAFRDIGADRLVLFADVPGALNCQRVGENAKNETVREAASQAVLAMTADHAKQLLQLLGFAAK
jgi:hypothetical protein